MSQTRRLPIFPLPDVVFLPETQLPLHVFEPRYRALLADALEGWPVSLPWSGMAGRTVTSATR